MIHKTLFLAVGLGIFWGCGSGNEIPRTHVEGFVTFEKEPISNGFILFVPISGVKGAPVQLDIKEGRYSSKTDKKDSRGVVIGQNDVQIMATKGTGRKVRSPDGNDIEEIVQFIPARFNEQTELRKDIKSGKNEINFELE